MSTEVRRVKLLLVAEIVIEPNMASPIDEILLRLANLRKGALPKKNYGLSIFTANPLDVQQVVNEGKTVNGLYLHAIVDEVGVIP